LGKGIVHAYDALFISGTSVQAGAHPGEKKNVSQMNTDCTDFFRTELTEQPGSLTSIFSVLSVRSLKTTSDPVWEKYSAR